MAGAIVQSAQTFVQTNPGTTTLTVSLTSTTAGNTIVAIGHDGNGINRAMTCADNVNGSYGTQLDNVNDSTNGNTIRSWVMPNIAGGTVTVTLTLPAMDGFSGLYAAEISGVTTTPLDGHSGADQASVANGGAISSGAASNTAPAFMLGLSVQDSSTAGRPTVGAGFTIDPHFASGLWNNGTNSATVEFKASVAAGSNAATFTNGLGSTQTFNTVMVMLNESGGSTQSFSYTMVGGMSFAGSASESRVVALPARSGGLTFSGIAAEVRRQIKTASGGITFAGTAAQARAHSVTASGGLQFGGTAAELRKKAYTGSGGLIFSGTAGYSSSAGTQSFSYTMVGGLTFSGFATYSNVQVQHFAYTASGGLVFSGTTSELRKRTISPSGGIVFGGTGSEIGIHPGTSTSSPFRRRFYGPVKRGR